MLSETRLKVTHLWVEAYATKIFHIYLRYMVVRKHALKIYSLQRVQGTEFCSAHCLTKTISNNCYGV